MQLLPEFPDRYWLKFSEEPVEIVPYDAQAKTFAAEYEQKLQDLLKEYPVQIYHRGSTALEIAGKGDIEIGVIPDPEYWFEIIVFLAQQFQGLGNLDEEYARFNDVKDGFDIEIILMRGYTALLDRRLHDFLRGNASLLQEYERIKKEFCFSQREYNRQKDVFFRKVITQIPEYSRWATSSDF